MGLDKDRAESRESPNARSLIGYLSGIIRHGRLLAVPYLATGGETSHALRPSGLEDLEEQGRMTECQVTVHK